MTGFIGQPSMSSSIEKQKDNTKALLVKLLERLGLENSTGSHSNPKPSVNPIVYYTSANTSPTGYPYFQAQPIPQPTTTPGLVQFVPHAQSVVNCRFVMPAQHATPAQQVNSTQQVTPGKPTNLPHAFTTGTLHDPDAWNMDTDVWTSPIPSLSGFKYYVLFLDQYSQFVWVYPLLNKSDAWSKFVLFRTYVRTQFKCEIRSFQCDHGGEFDNRNFHKLFDDNGIQFRFSCPKTSQQNGKSERMVHTINNLIRTLLFQANLPPTFWVEALNVATHLLNFLPSTAIHNEIPYTRLFGTNPDYSLLRTFGCLCYPHLDTNHKLEPRATPLIYLGQASNHRGYRCLDLKTNKIIISCHVTFDETVFPYGSTQPALPPTYTFLDDIPDIILPTIPTNPVVQLPPEPITPIHNTPIQHHLDTA
ncbi:ribonuclease H-like domain-containing protein [Tanacetum coccineum]